MRKRSERERGKKERERHYRLVRWVSVQKESDTVPTRLLVSKEISIGFPFPSQVTPNQGDGEGLGAGEGQTFPVF